MRSKEVDEAIKSCNLLLMGDITLHIINDDGGTGYAGVVDKQYNDDLKTLLNYISDLENKLKQAKEYIEEEMYVDENPTLYSEEDYYKPLPMSLSLWDEDLRKLLDMLEN